MKIKIKLILIFTFAIFASVFFVSKGEMQSKSETAGEKFKSIKVLNDMPADQLGKVMNMMSASLGVNCAFCHASNNGDFEKEGFEHKDTAREMLKMTFDLNKNYFEGRPVINCNTCHQGFPVPRSAISLTPNIRPPRPALPDVKPTVEEILAKYEKALGGRANLAKITSRQIKARRIEPDGKTFEYEEISQKPGKMSVTTVYPSKEYRDYIIREIFDGTAALKFGNGAKIELREDESEQIAREAQIFANPNLKTVYVELTLDSLAKIDGKDAFVLVGKTAENKGEKLYFDVSSGFLVRRTASTPTVLGDFVYQVDYSDYKNFGGVKLPTVVKFAVPNIYWTRRILNVKNNIAIDDASFSQSK